MASDDVHFSTTDREGCIRTGNNALLQVSGYSLDELVGQPQGVLNHPSMPGAIFELLRERISDGRPAVGYVQNRAKDGSDYWTFVAITSLSEGYLSIGLLPRSHYAATARKLYVELRTVEQDARDAGGDPAAVAKLGADRIGGRLQRFGFDSYDRFMAEALPTEITARSVIARPESDPLPQGPLGEVLGSALALDGQLSAPVDHLDGYRDLSLSIASCSVSMMIASHQIARAVGAVRGGATRVAGDTSALRSIADSMKAPAEVVLNELQRLGLELDALRAQVSELRVRIALARLNSEVMIDFVREVLGGKSSLSAFAAVPVLCEALHESVAEMAVATVEVNDKLLLVGDGTTRAAQRLEQFRDFMAQWRTLAIRRGKSGELGRELDTIDRQLESCRGQLAELRRVESRCRSEVVPVDVEALAGPLTRMGEASRPFLIARD